MSSGDEEGNLKYPKFNPKSDGKNPELMIGMIFSTKNEAKFAIESHCFRRGMAHQFTKNDNRRLRAICKKEGCGWFVYVAKMQNDHSWQLRSYNSVHDKCNWNYHNPSLNSGWIGKTFAKKFKSNPALGAKTFREDVSKKLGVNISMQQAYRAKKKASEMIEGTTGEQFNRIWDYCLELERANPNSTIIMKLVDDEVTHLKRFQRFYMCFSACKQGFKTTCRPIIGVDGCFLKGENGQGQLLSAVGLDPNNNIYPITHAIVERETKDTWMWFLKLLTEDLEITDDSKWTFMSDKQKGLIPAFDTLFPNAENRFCVRHLHSNMKKDWFHGTAIKEKL